VYVNGAARPSLVVDDLGKHKSVGRQRVGRSQPEDTPLDTAQLDFLAPDSLIAPVVKALQQGMQVAPAGCQCVRPSPYSPPPGPCFRTGGAYGFVGFGSSPAPATRAAQSRPRWTISRACGTSKSDATWPSVVLKIRPFP
jgi:hypothetical protein